MNEETTMGQPQPQSGSSGHMSDEDTLLLLSPVILVVVLGSLPMWWAGGAQWLIAHHVLIAASSSPLVAVPGTNGAGLDLRRVAIAAAVVLVALACAVSALRHRYRRAVQQRLQGSQ